MYLYWLSFKYYISYSRNNTLINVFIFVGLEVIQEESMYFIFVDLVIPEKMMHYIC